MHFIAPAIKTAWSWWKQLFRQTPTSTEEDKRAQWSMEKETSLNQQGQNLSFPNADRNTHHRRTHWSLNIWNKVGRQQFVALCWSKSSQAGYNQKNNRRCCMNSKVCDLQKPIVKKSKTSHSLQENMQVPALTKTLYPEEANSRHDNTTEHWQWS